MDSLQSLPPLSTLSTSVASALNAKLGTNEDLTQAPSFVAEFLTQCDDLERNLLHLNSTLESSLASYAFFSNRIGDLFSLANSKLADLGSSVCSRSSVSDGEGLGEELPSLAKEVARLEAIRAYAEVASKLDNLIGDIEDAISSTMNKNLRKDSSARNPEETRLVAIKTLKQTEDLLTSVTKARPQWARLVSAVDHRVDRALAILRPQAIADHRALLTSFGWPPALSNLTSSNMDTQTSSEVTNPLFTMHGDLKHRYCENFLALCRLQELQRQRKSRQLEGHNREVALHQPLWAVEELVNPVSIACQRHFSKWIDKPEFIFALVYKITRDYVDSMDELLQPLVDESLLTGYSCREEWISSMVTSLSTYLAKEIFPIYIRQLEEESATDLKSQARTSWLNLIDLMVNFDKRIKSLIEQSGILLSLQEDGTPCKISSLSVFCDRPDWLDIWAKIDLDDAIEKLKPEIDDERNWIKKVQGADLSNSDDYKSPAVSSITFKCLSSLIERCLSLPTVSLRSRFLRLTGIPVINFLLDCLLLRCQEAEGLTALTDDDALIKVSNSINAAHYSESILKEWCEDVFFLEMALDQGDHLGGSVAEYSGSEGPIEEYGNGIFHEEIVTIEDFRTQWVEKVTVVILRGFESLCRDYIKNRRQWQETSEEGWTVSKTLVGALDYLQAKMSVIEENLNRLDFPGIWRSLASRVDRLIFNGILISNAKFHDDGVERFGYDMEVLFGVFRAWCLRPQGFFPKVGDGLKLLKMEKEQLQDGLKGGQKWIKENGIRHLSAAEVEKIGKNRVYTK
ncbi:RINT1-like protein MAG2 [Hibiscus syriacus]|uniref:RINT1-like protein MAG2 n=1 Tax=Hibiscus syriacus TaxID=106335 RepID=A0A6A3AUK3_HIBSY|nr:RINT1-like protein MAG2 isoform X1 [Hibiscus syriacus]XP_038997198.1 RINT1-like protein MAG2 isoform X2 [Hibiscus syriacus]KAE8707403.1 RINT1-like protein MAG2 [Hibiscus syriacus]